MAKKFSISGLMNEHSKAEGFAFKIEMIPLGKIKPSGKNIYRVDDIAELKASIELTGLQQNLLVRETGSGEYELVSGHRRLLAVAELRGEGRESFSHVPCKVVKTASDIEAEMQLIFANSTTRRLNDYELVTQAARLREILTELKESGYSYTGKKRDIIAGFLDVSPSQVSKYESIAKNLSPEFRGELKHDRIGVTAAYELSKLPESEQGEAYRMHKSGEKPAAEFVKDKTGQNGTKRDAIKAAISGEGKNDAADVKTRNPGGERANDTAATRSPSTGALKEKEPLKPCPFCGAEAKLSIDPAGPYGVRCSNNTVCGVATMYKAPFARPTAADIWNRRT